MRQSSYFFVITKYLFSFFSFIYFFLRVLLIQSVLCALHNITIFIFLSFLLFIFIISGDFVNSVVHCAFHNFTLDSKCNISLSTLGLLPKRTAKVRKLLYSQKNSCVSRVRIRYNYFHLYLSPKESFESRTRMGLIILLILSSERSFKYISPGGSFFLYIMIFVVGI